MVQNAMFEVLRKLQFTHSLDSRDTFIILFSMHTLKMYKIHVYCT